MNSPRDLAPSVCDGFFVDGKASLQAKHNIGVWLGRRRLQCSTAHTHGRLGGFMALPTDHDETYRVKDSPHEQERPAIGLLNWKPLFIMVCSKSISVPFKNR